MLWRFCFVASKVLASVDKPPQRQTRLTYPSLRPVLPFPVLLALERCLLYRFPLLFRFRTPAACFEPRLQVIAVSGDRPDRLLPGEPSLWRILRERVSAPRGQSLHPIDLVLHVGGQACMADAFEEAWELLRRRAMEPLLCADGGWREAQEEATERLREVTRTKVLRQACALPAFINSSAFSDTAIWIDSGHRREYALTCTGYGVYRRQARNLKGAKGLSTTTQTTCKGDKRRAIQVLHLQES